MKSQELAAALSPFKLIANKNALSATYRSLELSPTHVRGCASYALLERKLSLGLETTCYVDATAFLAVIDSLPADEEVKLDLNENVLSWSCGAARGKLACAIVSEMPTITKRAKPDAWKPSEAFLQALELGAVSCDTQALSSVGLYGIVIDNRVASWTTVHSSDNVTISACSFEGEIPDAPERVTLPPDAIALMCKVLKPDEGALAFDETSVFYRNGDTRLLVKQVAPLKNDPQEVLDTFADADMAVELPHERVSAFIKRANALAESKRAVYVTLGASKGQLSLSFAEGVAASDEYYLIDNLDVPDLPEIKLDAGKLARALSHVTDVVLDHIERRVIVLRGVDPEFVYLIGGRE